MTMADHLARIDHAVSILRERIEDAVAAAAMPQGDSATMGEMIRQRRAALGMSLEEVGRKAGCTKSHVWELEQDRARNPTIAMVYGLSAALSVPFPIMAAAALATVLAKEDGHG